MSENDPVALEGIPVFTGNLALLDTQVTALTKSGATISTTAGDVHSSFGGLQAFYRAPEAEQLFATTKPVADTGLSLKSDLSTIASALSTYSDDAYPLVEKLKELKRDAGAFLVKADADDKWREDGDLVEENNNRHNEIAETWAAFQAVERACHAKIVALVGGTPLKTDDGSGKEGTYGYDAEALKHAKGLPWGDPVEESKPWWHLGEHLWDFTKGVFVDGVWGTIKGLGTLFGTDGWDAAKQAWSGLQDLTTGVILTVAAPGLLWATPEDRLPGFARDSRRAMKETGKALLAWDQWGENPSRAAGAVTFNVLTTVFTGGAGGGVSGAGKAAVAAKALSFAGKAGRIIDPMTYVFKGAGAGLTKISDVMAGLKGSGAVEIPPLPDNIFTLPEGAVRFPDGTVDLPAGTAIPDGAVKLRDGTVQLPEGVVALPEGTVKSPFAEGAPYMDREGHLYNNDGSLAQLSDDAPNTSGTHAPVPDRSLVGAGAHADAGRTGSDLSGGRPGGPVPGEGSHPAGGTAGGTIRNGHTDPTPSSGNHVPGPSPVGGHSAHDPTSSGAGHGAGGGQGIPHQGGHTGWHSGGPDEFGPPGSDIGSHNGTGADGARTPDQVPVHLEGERIAQQPSGRMAPTQEADVTAALTESKIPHVDQERMLTQLRKSPYGAAVADHITNGHFARMPGYKSLIFQVKQGDMIPAVHQAMEHASELRAKSMDNIEFELKLPEEKLDLDVLSRSKNGIEYGAQLKTVESANGISSAVKGIAAKQLAGPGVKVKVAILDIQDAKGAITEQVLNKVQRAADRTNASFELRFQDGSITVYPAKAVEP
ncbi:MULTISPECIES: hypothetical protein [unclassified Streptomyces]|uniref:hypothetical protein n=1 Tax=unclassified Streptomyces TaxID=2593676 RepID=UPI00093E6771|nr:hypothetical protein [Streptomyces sp. TSRI0281]OKI38372.1 hypothetical protein A6A29_10410 [Streptomyces sp. TSRI0281]